MALGKGQPAPDIAQKTFRGLLDQGPVLLAFYKVSCPVCQLTLPFLERLRGSSVQIVPVDQDDTEAAAEFDAEFGTRTGHIDNEDSGFALSNAFGITHVPSMFLVEPSGSVTWTSTGFFKRELEELAARAGKAIFRPGEKVPEAKSG